jgi:hypothetical protein
VYNTGTMARFVHLLVKIVRLIWPKVPSYHHMQSSSERSLKIFAEIVVPILSSLRFCGSFNFQQLHGAVNYPRKGLRYPDDSAAFRCTQYC